MKLNTILILCILVFFSACKSQTHAEKVKKQNIGKAIGTVVTELPAKVWAIFQDSKDKHWFGSNGEGVFRYDGKELRKFTMEDGLVDDAIRGIQSDTSGNIYIETPAGISKYDGNSFTTLQLIISDLNQWQLEPTDLWFSCNASANDIYRYDGENLFELKLPKINLREAIGINTEVFSFNPYAVYGIDKDSKGNLWIGTVVSGAYRYDGRSFLLVTEKELSILDDGRIPGLRSMVEDKDGNFWLSNFISRYKINVEIGTTEYEKLEGVDMSKGHFDNRLPYFNEGLVDANNDLWMASYGTGAWKYDGEELTNYVVKDGETEALLITIYKDNEGVLWLGSDNVGVFRYIGEAFEKFLPEKK